jgi:hypothetical protein
VGRTIETVDDLGEAVTKRVIPPIETATEKTRDWSDAHIKAQEEIHKSTGKVREFDDSMFQNTETTNKDIEAKKEWIQKTGEAREEHEKFTEGVKKDVDKTFTPELWDPMSQGFKDGVDDMKQYFKDGLDEISDYADEHSAIWDNMGTWTNPDGSKTNEIPIGDGTTWITGPEGRRAITLGIDSYDEFLKLQQDSAQYRWIKYGIPLTTHDNQPTPAADFESWHANWQTKWDPMAQANTPTSESQAEETVTPATNDSQISLNMTVNVGGTSFDAAINESIKLNPEIQNNIRRTIDV